MTIDPTSKDIFFAAMDVPEEQRRTFLDDACRGDRELRAEVEQLLAAHRGAGSFLEPPTESMDVPDKVPPALPSGTTIGPYRIRELLGEGGFGAVYRADQQEPLRREVALKVIKLGMDTRQVIARFEAERQALALMDHPNVAQVFDAGTEGGRPYFVMEYVPGESITSYCDRQRLSIRERLDLFSHVCQALQHAHQKGIIHRDIKPSNILVSVVDDEPRVKVIDFGIAKAVGRPLTEQSVFTEQGQLIGTPEYMSPEQAEMTALDVDTRSDIYSLGVLLYELLTGSRPFESETLRRAGLAEIQRIIREVDPPKPSTRLSTARAPSEVEPNAVKLDHADDKPRSLADIAKHRHAGLPSLKRQVHGDLDCITMKALEKDRTRRYASASELAADIERYLRDEPVIAKPPSVGYRVSKFARRHRTEFVAIVAMASVLLMATVVSVVAAMRASVASQKATAEAQRRTIAEGEARAAADTATRALEQTEEAAYVASIAATVAAIDSAQIDLASQYLEAAPTRLRRWEWSYLDGLTDQAVESIPLHRYLPYGPEPRVRDISYSADGSRIALVDLATTRLIDSATGRVLATWPDAAMVVAWASELIASGGQDGQIRLRDPTTGSVVQQIAAHDGALNSLSASPNGRALLSCSSIDRMARLWDVTSGALLAAQRDVLGLSSEFSPDGTMIAVGTREGIIIWDAKLSDRIAAFDLGWPSSLAFSPDGKSLAASSRRVVRIWNLESQTETHALQAPWTISSVDFSPDSTQLIAGATRAGQVQLWSMADGEASARYSEESTGTVVDFAPTGRRFVSGKKIWDSAYPLELGQRQVTAFCFTPDGRMLVSATRGDQGAQIHLWDLTAGVEVATLHGPASLSELTPRHRETIAELAVSTDGKYLLSRSTDSMAKLWDISTGAELATQQGLAGSGSLAWIDSQHVVAERESIVVWDTETGRKCMQIQGGGYVNRNSLSPDGSSLAVVRRTGFFELWNVASGKLVTSEAVAVAANAALSFSRDGSTVVVGSDYSDRAIGVWDVATGRKTMSATGRWPRLSPDGRRLIAASGDGEARQQWSLWDTRTAEQLASSPRDRPHRFASFSHDGQLLAWSFRTGRVEIRESVDGRILQSIEAPGDAPFRFSPNDRELAFWSDWRMGGEVSLWQVADGRRTAVMEEHARMGRFSDDGSRLIGIGNSSTSIWESSSGALLSTLPVGRRRVVIDDDGTRAIGLIDGRVVSWDLSTGQELFSFTTTIPVEWLVCANERVVVAQGSDQKTTVWQIDDPADVQQRVPCLWTYEIAVSDDGRRIVAIERSLRVIDVLTHNEVLSLEELPLAEGMDSHGSPFVVNTRNKLLAFRQGQSNVMLWSTESGETIRTLEEHGAGVLAIALSSDATVGASVDKDGMLLIWDVASLEVLGEITIGSTATGLAMTEDGSRVALLCPRSIGRQRPYSEGQIIIMDTRTGSRLLTINTTIDEVDCYTVSFSPDGTRLVFANEDSIRVLDSCRVEERVGEREEAERAMTLVAPMVDQLYEDLDDPHQIVDRVRQDPTLTEVARQQALNLALRRAVERRHSVAQPTPEDGQ